MFAALEDSFNIICHSALLEIVLPEEFLQTNNNSFVLILKQLNDNNNIGEW